MTVVDCFVSQPHYVDHVAAVWRALGAHTGHLWAAPAAAGRVAELGLSSRTDGGTRGDTILTASWADARCSRQWSTVALMEHGVGQTYGTGAGHPAYAGGEGRCGHVDLFLCPNERVAVANRSACPEARVEVVGTPWLDVLAGIERRPDVDVAVSFHWDCDLCPETRCTADDWWPSVVDLAAARSVLGHGHPRAQPVLFPSYWDAGIETVARFEDVVARARVFVADNTSALYLAAAVGLGVVVLDSPGYRRHVDHGLRFWEMADVGVRVDRGPDLAVAVRKAMAGPTDRAAAIVGELFPYRGCAVERTVGALHRHGVSSPRT